MNSDSEEPFEDSFIDPAVLLGVWADATRVDVGRGEFTIDCGVSSRLISLEVFS